MSRDRWVLAATLLAESAWLFAAFGAAGVVTGRDISPLSWPALMAIMGCSMYLVRLGRLRYASIEITPLIRGLIGAAVVYLTVGTQMAPGPSGLDMLWVARIASQTTPDGFTFSAVSGSVIGVVLWWRAGKLAASELPVHGLGLSFRVGLVALAVATGVDIASEATVHAFPMVFVFFASGLGGLSIGHLLPESEKSAVAKTWPKVILGTVAGILVVGLLFSLFHRDLLSYISVPLLKAASMIAAAIVWGVIVPIAFVVNVVTDLVLRLFSRSNAGEAPEITGLEEFTERAQEVVEGSAVEEAQSFFNFIQLVEWALMTLVALFLLYLLTIAFRRIVSSRSDKTEGHRESVREEADPAADAARLFFKLLPDWLKKRRGENEFTLPHGPSGIIDVLRIYYELLTRAEQGGITRGPHETATEFQGTLEAVFPQDLVRTATFAFNRAYYGQHPAPQEQIAAMRSALQVFTADSAKRGRGP